MRSLFALAEAVEAFESGDLTIRSLAARLDVLTVPQGESEEKTLRTVLAARRLAYESRAEPED